MPTSITIAPFLIQSPLTRWRLPAAEITKSDFSIICFRSYVNLWQTVIVAFLFINNNPKGNPTSKLLPIIVVAKPLKNDEIYSYL